MTDSIGYLLKKLDDEIGKYHKKHQIIIDELGVNGKIDYKLSDKYKQRQNKIWTEYGENVNRILAKLNEECHAIRAKQPLLDRIHASQVFECHDIPQHLAIGSTLVQYDIFNEKLPRVINFPIHCPVFATLHMEDKLTQVFLRLLFSLPPGKVTYYIFDAYGLGRRMADLSPLFNLKAVFPNGGAVYSDDGIKKGLQELRDEASRRIQDLFPTVRGCQDWTTYNSYLLSNDRTADMLDYKVIVFWGISESLNRDILQLLISLADVSKDAGMLLVYTCDDATIASLEEKKSKKEVSFNAEDIIEQVLKAQLHPYHNTIKTLFSQSVRIDNLISKLGDNYEYNYLNLKEINEPLPSKERIWDLIKEFKEQYEKLAGTGLDFEHIIKPRECWKESAEDALIIPVGHLNMGGIASMGIAGSPDPEKDIACHFLMGGATGSGKSNLLHNIILSAIFRYSPEELELYLMDLKDGVEFAVYAEGKLPHARLVALKADTEYGLSILQHLEKVRVYRNEELFRKEKVAGYKEYRKKQKLPRILFVIDEFQRLLENPKCIDILENLVKQGRSSGIHLLLATQSIKGLSEFSRFQSQFGGRIVLKCTSEEESQLLFGGISSGNTAAVELRRYHAILNTDSGRANANHEFLVPKAPDSDERLQITKDLQENARNLKKECPEHRVYYGDQEVTVPKREEFFCEKEPHLLLGVHQDFEENPFCVFFEKRFGNNILLCGNSKSVLQGLKESVLISADCCDAWDEIVYIGKYEIQHDLHMQKDFLVCFSLKEYMEQYGMGLLETRRLILLDSINCEQEIGYKGGTYKKVSTDHAKQFSDFLEKCNESGSLIVAFYDSLSLFKSSGLDREMFRHTVAFGLSNPEFTQILNLSSLPKAPLKNKAIYGHNSETEVFKPFVLM